MTALKPHNQHFAHYADYVRKQIRKVRQSAKGGLGWEQRVQSAVKPQVVRWVAGFQSPEQTGSVLVLGARWGADVLFLRAGGYDNAIVAIDLYDPPLSHLVQVGDAHHLDRLGLRLHSIDLVWAYHVIEHLWSPAFVLRDLLRFVRPTGRLFVAMPDFGVLDEYDAQDEYADKSQWEALVAECGWEIEAYDSYAIKGKRRPAHFYVLVPHGA